MKKSTWRKTVFSLSLFFLMLSSHAFAQEVDAVSGANEGQSTQVEESEEKEEVKKRGGKAKGVVPAPAHHSGKDQRGVVQPEPLRSHASALPCVNLIC